MFCENCGKTVSDGSDFCMSCGTKVAVTGASPPPIVSPPIPAIPVGALAQGSATATTAANTKVVEYQVIPFKADILAGQGAGTAAEQLQALINNQSSRGYRYLQMETLRTRITTPGNSGCFGIGAVPETVSYTDIYAVVFVKK